MPCRALKAFGPPARDVSRQAQGGVLMPCRALEAFGRIRIEASWPREWWEHVLMPCRALEAFGLDRIITLAKEAGILES